VYNKVRDFEPSHQLHDYLFPGRGKIEQGTFTDERGWVEGSKGGWHRQRIERARHFYRSTAPPVYGIRGNSASRIN
jgi:hypothetical protein